MNGYLICHSKESRGCHSQRTTIPHTFKHEEGQDRGKCSEEIGHEKTSGRLGEGELEELDDDAKGSIDTSYSGVWDFESCTSTGSCTSFVQFLKQTRLGAMALEEIGASQ